MLFDVESQCKGVAPGQLSLRDVVKCRFVHGSIG